MLSINLLFINFLKHFQHKVSFFFFLPQVLPFSWLLDSWIEAFIYLFLYYHLLYCLSQHEDKSLVLVVYNYDLFGYLKVNKCLQKSWRVGGLWKFWSLLSDSEAAEYWMLAIRSTKAKWRCCCLVPKSCSTPWTVARQVPLFLGFTKQEYYSELPFSFPGDLPNPGIEPLFLSLAGGFLTTEPPGKPQE